MHDGSELTETWGREDVKKLIMLISLGFDF
jgi:hypothetical protein